MRIPLFLSRPSMGSLLLLPPELAHRLTVLILKAGLQPAAPAFFDPALEISVAGLTFPNPLGIAAGFDKNAELLDSLPGMGFGFVEAGAVTPRPQPGNARPRVFRLREDEGVINRYGFNNDGLETIAERFARRKGQAIVGINLGANKTSEDRTADFVTGLQRLEKLADFCTVNISSPNTPGLRSLQDRAALDDLLTRVLAARTTDTPVFLKIAPDLTDEDKADIAAAALSSDIDGLVISNTTISRPNSLRSGNAGEAGGLSGAPLFELSTAVQREFALILKGRVPIIGVGGVSSAEQAWQKILAGASLIQLYTALIYGPPDLPVEILRGLSDRLKAHGAACLKDAVGAGL